MGLMDKILAGLMIGGDVWTMYKDFEIMDKLVLACSRFSVRRKVYCYWCSKCKIL